LTTLNLHAIRRVMKAYLDNVIVSDGAGWARTGGHKWHSGATRSEAAFGESEIDAVDETVVQFGRMTKSGERVFGTIDRVTGHLEVTSGIGNVTMEYSLKCRPAQRMF
jgi:hypothetical protein